MKCPTALILGMLLVAPAFAQAPTTDPSSANRSVRYAADAQRLGDGQFRAEVRRRASAGNADEVAWSSAPHATRAEALREACKMIETVYAPGTRCPPPDSKKIAQPAPAAKSAPAKSAPKAVSGNVAKAKLGSVSPVSGYEVRGCAFYALVNGRVVQRCPSEGSPGTKPFWHNEDAFEGGYGGWGR
jgi:hypothetical protein